MNLKFCMYIPHGYRAKIYQKRKDIPRTSPTKIRLSLTKRRTDLLRKAKDLTEGIDNVNFAYADVNGNLKIRTKSEVRDQMVFPLNSEQETYIDLFNDRRTPV